MMSGDTGVAIGVLTLAGTLLGVVITSTWRFSSLATKLTDTISQLETKARDLEKRDEELKEKYATIDRVPTLEFRISQIESMQQHVPKIMSQVATLEAKAEFSKEMRCSRPNIKNED